MEYHALRKLLVVERGVVILYNLRNDRCIGHLGLQKHLTLSIFSSGASCNLRHELEGPFGGSEIGVVEQRICIDDADNINIVKIKPF